jgi:hypothetical protein
MVGAVMQIEAGKYYRTRDGRKVGPMKAHSEGGWTGRCEDDCVIWGYHWSGRWGRISGGLPLDRRKDFEAARDLIAEWEETATLPAFLGTDNAKTIAEAIAALRKANEAAIDAKAFTASRAIIEAMEEVHKLMLEADE